MSWTLLQIITIAVSVIALLLSIANFVLSRLSARRDASLRRRDEQLLVDQLLDDSFGLLWGDSGYSKTKDRRKLEDAEVRIRKAMKIDPKHPRGTEYEGHIFELQGNKSIAKERYQKSVSLDPTRARPHNCLGLIAEGSEAIDHFKKAIELEPEQAALPWHNLGRAYSASGRHDDAENAFRKALELRPKYSHAHHELANLLKRQQRYEEAESEYELAIASDSNYIDPMVNLAQLLMDVLKREEDGLAWMEHARKIDPSNDYPLAMLAAIYADRKEPKRALDYAERAMALDPSRRFTGEHFIELRAEMLEIMAERDENSGME